MSRFAPTPVVFRRTGHPTFIFASLGVALAMLVQDHAGQAAVTNFVITR